MITVNHNTECSLRIYYQARILLSVLHYPVKYPVNIPTLQVRKMSFKGLSNLPRATELVRTKIQSGDWQTLDPVL